MHQHTPTRRSLGFTLATTTAALTALLTGTPAAATPQSAAAAPSTTSLQTTALTTALTTPALNTAALSTPALNTAAPSTTLAPTFATAESITRATTELAAQVPAARGASAMQKAMSKIGKPYVWGATGPNAFDCSGLVSWSYKQLGVSLPRSSAAMSRVGTPVAKSALRPGDLVFFYKPVSHVAIYIGNGKVVHASTSGQPVKISEMSRMPFNSARRV